MRAREDDSDAQDPITSVFVGLVEDGIPCTSFAVDDVQQEFERLSAAGGRSTVEPMDAGPVMVAVFDDTCGNLIQITSPRG